MFVTRKRFKNLEKIYQETKALSSQRLSSLRGLVIEISVVLGLLDPNSKEKQKMPSVETIIDEVKKLKQKQTKKIKVEAKTKSKKVKVNKK